MKIKNLLLLIFLLTGLSLSAQKKRDLKAMYHSSFNYEILCLGVGNDGTKAIKVWSYGKTVEKAVYNAIHDAVAAVIFKGIPAGGGAAPTPAIVGPSGYTQHEAFFDDFFKPGGMYLNFINLKTDGTPSGEDRIKVSKKEYKVAIYASINFDALRKYLEDSGVARRLDAGF